MTTLQDLLLARDGNPRAMAAALDVVGGVPTIRLGQLGEHPEIVLLVAGNYVLVEQPVLDKPQPFGGKGDHDGDGKPGGAKKPAKPATEK